MPWDVEFDHARAVKSELELESVRDSVRINTEGFWIFLEHFAPGKSEREILAHCEKYFVEEGCGRLTMDMVLVGDDGAALPEFKIAGDYRIKADRHGAAVARGRRRRRPLGRGVARDLPRRAERRDEADDGGLRRVLRRGTRTRCKDGATAHDVHRAVSKGFVDRGFKLGHVTGHSIGMTMIEWPKIGEGDETELRANMVFSMHPHAISQDGQACLYMQDTWLVTADGGVPLADLPMKIFDGTEATAMNELAKPILPGEGGSDYERYLRTDALLRAAEGRRRVGAPRRAALPDGAPVVGALAEARVERGRGGGPARRRRRHRRPRTGCCAERATA